MKIISIFNKLKSKTQHQHDRIEKTLSMLVSNDITLTYYKNYLIRMYGYIMPIENQINDFTNNAFPNRNKTQWLERDLNYYSIDSQNVILCLSLPLLYSWSSILGCMYVLEGSTLGGRIIFNQLKNKWGKNDLSGLDYFIGYGKQTGIMWQSFKDLITHYCQTQVINETVLISTAIETFETLNNWLKDINHVST